MLLRFLLLKAAKVAMRPADLFDAQVGVKGHVTRAGAYVAPYRAVRHKKAVPPLLLFSHDEMAARKPPSLDDAVRHKPLKAERDFHLAAWKQASPRMLAVISNMGPLGEVGLRHAGAAYFATDHRIMMGEGATPTTAPATWRHEYGHAIDFQGAERTLSMDLDAERRSEAEQLLARRAPAEPPAPTRQLDRRRQTVATLAGAGLGEDEVQAFTAGAPWRSEALAKLLSDAEPIPADLSKVMRAEMTDGIIRPCPHEERDLQDFLGAMTNNAVGWGHSSDYYAADPRRNAAEMFANYVSLSEGPGGSVYRAILHRWAPKCCAGFDRILDAVAARGRG